MVSLVGKLDNLLVSLLAPCKFLSLDSKSWSETRILLANYIIKIKIIIYDFNNLILKTFVFILKLF